MMIARLIMMGMFSFTAMVLLSYQGIEIAQAFMDYFRKN